ncbi:MAG: glycosyltransferase family 4 protein [Bryobacteraceae bacterium]
MRVLNVAYPLLPVTSGSAGGAEQILYLLDGGLAKRNIESIVIAAEGSGVSGKLRSTPSASGDITEAERAEAQRIHRRTIAEVLASEAVDLIHFHGLDFATYIPETRVPKLATLHLPISWYEHGSLDNSDVHLVSVSQTQANSAEGKTIFRFVPNGIDTSAHAPSHRERNSLLWLGRICPEKGTHIALQVARELDLPLTVAGPVHPFAFHRSYFETEVQPLLDSKRIYTGPVNLDQKITLLSRARALLVPSLAAETSSLVAMEAASSGTPVIAFRSGALPEVIQHGLTGFIVEDVQGMIRATARLEAICRSRCREYALENFSYERMVDDYVKLYRDLLAA